ncbi:unnamed protein product, partial [marine sediment metagenome]
ILDWWDVHRPQWAWPSQYPPPEGWKDHLRYKRGAKEVVKDNWFSQVSENNVSGERTGENNIGAQVSNKIGSGETPPNPLLTTHRKEETERGKRKEERGRGNSPETQNRSQVRNPSPSLTGLSLFNFLTDTFPQAFGRKPNSRETAQLRDLGKEISSAGGATAEQVYDAFKEAAGQNKLHISYIRKILHAWLGLERGPPNK